MSNEIDFVILWVDGSDPKWIAEKEKYMEDSPRLHSSDTSASRYRDWGLLKYWFRGIEKFAPWVRKVHFVTYGHLPKFLNTAAPKLHIVNHQDFIDEKYLPLFNSCAIEINIHKIPGLAEQFVYFNDDMFLTNFVSKKDFFKNGLPCEEGLQGTIASVGDQSSYYHQLLNDIDIINRNFNKRKQMSKNIFKWFNYRYGIENIRNLVLMPWTNFVGFKNSHLPATFLKSTFEEVWQKEGNILEKTSTNKFRNFYDVNQYVFRYWQLAKGNFVPRKSLGKMYEIHDSNVEELAKYIENQKYKVLCLNDPSQEVNFDRCQKILDGAFKNILSEKSSFEK